MSNKRKRNNSSSSSSEDEIARAAFKEATDSQFFQETLYNTKKDSTKEVPSIPEPANVAKSLRCIDSESATDSFQTFGLSQNIRDFIAKKLELMLEKEIKTEDIKDEVSNTKENITDTGIRLLSSSNLVLTTVDDLVPSEGKKKPKHDKKLNEAELKEHCKEVAVDGSWILSKKDTKAWCEKTKGTEFKYRKLKNGTLIES